MTCEFYIGIESKYMTISQKMKGDFTRADPETKV